MRARRNDMNTVSDMHLYDHVQPSPRPCSVVKIDSSPPVCFHQNFEWASKSIGLLAHRKSTKYSDHIDIVIITIQFQISSTLDYNCHNS